MLLISGMYTHMRAGAGETAISDNLFILVNLGRVKLKWVTYKDSVRTSQRKEHALLPLEREAI